MSRLVEGDDFLLVGSDDLVFLLQASDDTVNGIHLVVTFDYTLDLYEDGWMSTSDHGCTHMDYSETSRIIETKTDFYIMIAERQGVILPKEDCPEEAAAFLRGIKVKYDK